MCIPPLLFGCKVFQRTFFSFWIVCLPASFGLVVVLAQNLELFAVRREVKDGMYSPATYALVITIIQLPWMAILSVCALLPGGYGIEGFPLSGFGHVFLMLSTLLCCIANFAQMQALCTNPLVGMLAYLQGFSILLARAYRRSSTRSSQSQRTISRTMLIFSVSLRACGNPYRLYCAAKRSA